MQALFVFFLATITAAAASPVKVLVWDERQPKQAEAYDNFLGNEIAKRLEAMPGIEVISVGQDDPGHGLGSLDSQHVLLWWGHVRQGEIPDEVGHRIVERIRSGKLALVALHSAHWSVPFMEAMYARTRDDAKRRFPDPKTKIEFVPPPGRFPPTYDSIVTPAYYAFLSRGAVSQVRVDLPNCVFPGVDAHGRPSRITVPDARPPNHGGSCRTVRDPVERDVRRALPRARSPIPCSSRRSGKAEVDSVGACCGIWAWARSSTSDPVTRRIQSSRTPM